MSGTDVNLSLACPDFSRIATAESAQNNLDSNNEVSFHGYTTSVIASSGFPSFRVDSVDSRLRRGLANALHIRPRQRTWKVAYLPELENCSRGSIHTVPGLSNSDAASVLSKAWRGVGGNLREQAPRLASNLQDMGLTFHQRAQQEKLDRYRDKLIAKILKLYQNRTFRVADWDTSDDFANATHSRIREICLWYNVANPDEIDEEIKRLTKAILKHIKKRPDGELVEAVVKGAFGKTG
ncbi:hypothetical protein FFLO_00853 [Filobasidium floriforme]|uniref:Uncharacterized protein n=1 Tax=Filobasidium floriforme TaxID=5210 RepID=A0A8K0NQJ2_9TREE|nr:uncharacterized protein HD553DRAFT_340992 [Filobasidium floriforme]KAG7571180.1 hypothetical protein FFLO_00853 [Filobasidium floriforme]KAH8087019.1 hypothetical protein HD553DRAFT_340992 [Filobasidium floriforme]